MDPVTAEKVAARRRLGRYHALFRCVEACLALLLVFWSSLRGYAAARLAVGLLGRLLAGHRFIFLIGNAIVLTLFALSCRHAGAGGGDVYDQFLACQSRAAASRPAPLAEEAATPLPGKEGKAKRGAEEEAATPLPGKEEKAKRGAEGKEEKVRREACRRSQSVKMERRRSGTLDLRRSASDVSGVEAESDADAAEFQRMIESFIEMQQTRFRREESMAGVGVASSIPEEQPPSYTVTCS